MNNFGSADDAKDFFDLYMHVRETGDWQALDHNPDWEFIGSGSFRTCYLHVPTNVVYKVEDNYCDEEGMGNEAEHQNAQDMRREVWCGVYVPKTNLFTMGMGVYVLAMERILPNNIRVSGQSRMELFLKGGLGDMHQGNYRCVDGVIVPIDLASPRFGNYNTREPDRRVLSGL